MANLYIDCKFKNKLMMIKDVYDCISFQNFNKLMREKLKIDPNSEKIQVIFIIKANSSAIKQRTSKSFGICNIINAKF